MEGIRQAQRAEGPATILSIATATPSNCVHQTTFSDYYFRITNSQHMTQLKQKFDRICENSGIKKRYMHLTEELVKQNPNMAAYMAPSLDARQNIVVEEVPKLGKEAAEKAIMEWGQPKSNITHLVFCTSTGNDLPSADFKLVKLLGLSPSVKRCMGYNQGCYGGAYALRMAKDLAENNAGARVLVVCSEICTISFRGPSENNMENLVGQALFGDGAAAMIVGSDPVLGVEAPLFQIVSAAQTIIPDSDNAIRGNIREVGLVFYLMKEIPNLISRNVEKCLEEALWPYGIRDWNSIFWIAHPGGPAVLNELERVLGLKPEKLRSTRRVLSEYGNMLSSSVVFILDEMRKFSTEQGLRSTAEGLDWGVLLGFGPGITVETLVLRSVPA